MATYTPNLNLIKPEDSDFFSKDHQNGNMDKIDALAGDVNTLLVLKKVVINCKTTDNVAVESQIVKSGITNKYYVSNAAGVITIPYNLVQIPVASDTITVIDPLDATASASTFTVDLTTSATQTFTLTLTASSTTEFTFTSTTTKCVTSLTASLTLWIYGAGGSGALTGASAEVYYTRAATGGGGGYTVQRTFTFAQLKGMVLQFSVGAGGAPKTSIGNGNAGGATTIVNLVTGETILNVNGGSGGNYAYATSPNIRYGANGAAGGSGSGAASSASTTTCEAGIGGADGGNGASVTSYSGGVGQGTTTYIFGESTNTLCCGGGGSISACNWNSKASGGGSGGGTGGVFLSNASGGSATATVYGAGSGGVGYVWNSYSGSAASGQGGPGVCCIRRTIA